MSGPQALFFVLMCATAARAQEPFVQPPVDRVFTLKGRVDCRSAPSPQVSGVPKNSVLLVFDEESTFGEPFKWVVTDKAAFMRSIQQLLDHYKFPLTVREMSKSDWKASFYGGQADIALDYWNNSFVVNITESCRTAGSTTLYPICDDDDGCYDGGEVYGPELRHYAPQSCVQSIGSVKGDVNASLARRRAYLTAILVHEVIHAAHGRLLAGIMGTFPTTTPKECPLRVPLATAVERTKTLRKKLGIPRGALHMAGGLMTAGISLEGNPGDHAGGGSPNMAECLGDKRLRESDFADVGALAANQTLCTDYNQPVAAFFAVPSENLSKIKDYLDSRRFVKCHSACYYELSANKMPVDR